MSLAQFGAEGEALAADYLVAKGYRVLGRNIRTPLGEIDLLCARHRTLVFVEVKTRTSHAFGPPEAAITPTKQRRLMRVAEWFSAHHDEYRRWPHTIDVVAITRRPDAAAEIVHLPNVVGAAW
ncbi:YraN family protein [Candidatus Uhrbacteria bacterium]|nr:YraN family protein [Candidatus Uhrbacteria bacterium]